jgi:F420-non-reducing hydrogenase iron-sulfur subunit
VNCAARIDPDHILWALLNDIDGVFLGVCQPCECHYGSGGRYLEQRVEELKKQLDYYGIDPNRICLEFMVGNNGENFARSINDFAKRLAKLKSFKKTNNNPSGGLDVEKIRSRSMGS